MARAMDKVGASLRHADGAPGRGCSGGFVLRFEPMNPPGRTLDIPCDEHGRVELDTLSDAARCNYLFARAVVGRAYSAPVVIGTD